MPTSPRLILALVIVLISAAIAGCSDDDDAGGGQAAVPDTQAPAETATPSEESQPDGVSPRVETVAEDLEVPWAVDFAPDGTLFFTERPGRIAILEPGSDDPEVIETLPDTAAVGEGGLLGLRLHPEFEDEPQVFVYQTYRDGGNLSNRILRFDWNEDDGTLSGRRVLLDGIPGGNIHDGGALAFGPDGHLYASTGDAGQARLAQDGDSLAGKILRLTTNGEVPDDNPFGDDDPVYTLGHRNAQGLAFHPNGELYATEHGPEGDDELNQIVAGENYGWPEAQGSGHGDFHAPLAVYSQTIAPTGLDVYQGPIRDWDGDLFWGTLGFSPEEGRHLRRAELEAPDEIASQDELYDNRFGRLRAVRMGPDDCLYVSSSNRDGRGDPESPDDRILRVCPEDG